MGTSFAQFFNETPAALAALTVLAAMGSFGVAALRRVAPFLQPLERVAYGFPLGVVVASLALLFLACGLGLSTGLVIATGLACAIGAILVWPGRPLKAALCVARIPRLWKPRRAAIASLFQAGRSRMSLLPTLVIGAFVLRWAILWVGALTYTSSGLWAGHTNIWGDWSLHIGDTTSFAYGDNFPPAQPRLSGYSHAYHYLASLTAAAMVKVGMDPVVALPLHSFLFSVLIAVGVYAFGRRLTNDRAAAALALVFFMLGGGFGWLITLQDSGTADHFFEALFQQPWNEAAQRAANVRWLNSYFAFIMPQRAYLYGLPLGLLILTLLLTAVQENKPRMFLTAGVVAGLLPLAHLGTLLALALVTPCLLLLFPSRRWFLFFGVWVAIAVPQLYFQQGGQRGALGALRIQVGWIAAPDPWPWFWLKNLGLFLPLLALALVIRNVTPAPARRFIWAFMPVFLIANLVVFQPWDWDNTKVLLYWFLAICILVAALLVKIWRKYGVPLGGGMLAGVGASIVQGVLVGLTITMIMPGLLENLSQLLGKDRHLFLSGEEVQLAMAVRDQTPQHTIFVVGLQNNHPIPMLTGRQVVMSYPGWLWSQGFDYAQRERDLRAIYTFAPDAAQLLAQYHVDYVVIGSFERSRLQANLAAYQARYPCVIRTANYEIFAVGERLSSP